MAARAGRASSAGIVIAPPATRASVIAPPLPRSSAIVDPRVGDHGPALLALEDGHVFPGISFGAPLAGGGDLVVNTSQTGYQEVCTDPSYAGQLVVMTYPLIGNYGRLLDDDQSPAVAPRPDRRQRHGGRRGAGGPARGPAARRRASRRSPAWTRARWPATCGPSARVKGRSGRPASWIRDGGRRGGAARPALGGPGLRRRGLAGRAVRRRRPGRGRTARRRSSTSGSRPTSSAASAGAAPGCGSCHTRPRSPDALAADLDGVVLSPGPGDPARLDRQVAIARAAIADGRPLLGICLGHQIVGLAAGAETRRLRFGHHGANHPIRDLDSGQVQVTAQNHEVQVVADSLPAGSGFRVSQLNLNDGSVEGLRHATLPIETVQYHPEGAPGPLDALAVFDRFLAAAVEAIDAGAPPPARRGQAGVAS